MFLFFSGTQLINLVAKETCLKTAIHYTRNTVKCDNSLSLLLIDNLVSHYRTLLLGWRNASCNVPDCRPNCLQNLRKRPGENI